MTRSTRLYRASPIDRFWHSVDKDGAVPTYRPELGACWIWHRSVNAHGYGRLHVATGYNPLAHRFSWELHRGPIPSGMQIDHLCRVRRCVRPDHLEPVDARENARRGLNGELKTTCSKGHPLTEANVRREANGRRRCRTCDELRNQQRLAERARLAGTEGHVGGAAVNAAKTHCKRGHLYDEANTYRTKAGTRACLTCKRAATAAWNKSRKA